MTLSIDELKTWCLNYSKWKDICNDASKIGGGFGSINGLQEWKDDTGEAAYILDHAQRCVDLIEGCADSSNLLLVVTEDIPPSYLGVSDELYERFFARLSYKIHPL